MNTPNRWSRLLIIAGNIGMLVGAIDPMEGSLLILPSSGLVALGVFTDQQKRRLIVYRFRVFILIAIGVGALLVVSMLGGLGGETGLSNWWGIAILPYPIGWSLGIWGPGSPRWMLWLGISVSLWYLAIFAMALNNWGTHDWLIVNLTAIVLCAIGLLTLSGCIYRLRAMSHREI